MPVTTPAPDNCWECKKTYSIETGSGGTFGEQVLAPTESEAATLCQGQANEIYGSQAGTITVSVEEAVCETTTTPEATTTTGPPTYEERLAGIHLK